MTARRTRIATGALVAACLLVAACSSAADNGDGDASDLGDADPGDCTTVDMAVSSREDRAAHRAGRTTSTTPRRRAVDGCASSSGRTARPRARRPRCSPRAGPTRRSNGARPVIWSPAASGWGAHRQRARRARDGAGGTPFMLTPLVIAMPKPMAEALGYPDTPIGFADIVALANDPEGWAAYGHPEWGPFRLGKTNPNFSTSGLNFTIAEYYAATGKTARPHRRGPRPARRRRVRRRASSRPSCTTATSR